MPVSYFTDDLCQLCQACVGESSGADIDEWVRSLIQLQICVEDRTPPWIGHLNITGCTVTITNLHVFTLSKDTDA